MGSVRLGPRKGEGMGTARAGDKGGKGNGRGRMEWPVGDRKEEALTKKLPGRKTATEVPGS